MSVTLPINNLSKEQLEILSKIGVNLDSLQKAPKEAKKRNSSNPVGTAPPEYTLCIAYKCKLCKTIIHKYFKMVKHDSQHLRSIKLKNGDIPEKVDRRECYVVESCGHCKNYLKTLTHEELINKVLYYAYAYRERMDVRTNPCKVCDEESKEIKAMEKKESQKEALEKTLSDSILSYDEIGGA